MLNKIVDPKTGKSVNLLKDGRRILKNYILNLNKTGGASNTINIQVLRKEYEECRKKRSESLHKLHKCQIKIHGPLIGKPYVWECPADRNAPRQMYEDGRLKELIRRCKKEEKVYNAGYEVCKKALEKKLKRGGAVRRGSETS